MPAHRHYRKPLPSKAAFALRFLRKAAVAAGVVAVSLLLGACGYHFSERLPWIDAFLNAAMILAGEGPVNAMQTAGGKLFATFYALFSGVVFITLAAVLFAPVLHRFLHRFHLDLEEEAEE